MALIGIPRSAVKGQGGIKRVWLADFEAVTNKEVAEGVLSFTSAADAWKEFVLGKEAGSNEVETLTGNVQAGTNQVEQVLTMIFKKNQTSKRNEASVIAASETIAIIEDNNGFIKVYGVENGLDQTSGVSGSGAQYGELNGLTLTLRGLERDYAPTISPADYELIVAGSAVS